MSENKIEAWETEDCAIAWGTHDPTIAEGAYRRYAEGFGLDREDEDLLVPANGWVSAEALWAAPEWNSDEWEDRTWPEVVKTRDETHTVPYLAVI